MNTFWLKIAAAAVGVVVVVVLIGMFTSGGTQKQAQPDQPDQPQKTFQDQAEEDKEKFLAEPQKQETRQQTQTAQQDQSAEEKPVTEPIQPATPQLEQPKPATLYFKPLSEIDKIEAERLLNVAVPGRSIGRLPMTGYSLMVPNCREIIKRWPDSWYAYRARQLLADLPPRYHTQYNVTKEDIDLGMYYKQRPGTEPYTMEGTR